MKGKFLCPCGRNLRVNLMRYATDVVRRTCPKCRSTWQIVIKPNQHSDVMSIHTLEAVKIK